MSEPQSRQMPATPRSTGRRKAPAVRPGPCPGTRPAPRGTWRWHAAAGDLVPGRRLRLRRRDGGQASSARAARRRRCGPRSSSASICPGPAAPRLTSRCSSRQRSSVSTARPSITAEPSSSAGEQLQVLRRRATPVSAWPRRPAAGPSRVRRPCSSSRSVGRVSATPGAASPGRRSGGRPPLPAGARRSSTEIR